MNDINYPRVFLYHNDGGHIYRSNRVPTRKQEGKPSPFTILPLDDDGIVQLKSPINTRGDYIDALKSWKRVVIQDQTGKFLSCGTFIGPTASAFAWFKREKGISEQFELEYCSSMGTFSFKSYNGLYLHYTPQLGTVSFKTREAKESSWHIHPLDVVASDSEQILFVGVASKEKGFLLQRTAEGVANKEWDVGLDSILDNLMEHLIIQVDKEGGSCTFFQHPTTQHQWCVTRSNEHSLNIVVSSENFPHMFASECVEEVEDIFKQFNDEAKDERLKMNGINDKKDYFNKLLSASMFEYDDQYTRSSIAAVHREQRKAIEKMAENIRKMQENIASEEELQKVSDELLEFALQFKKQSSRLRLAMWKKAAIVGGVVLGGASGALAGFCIGGHGGAAVLGTEAAEVAAGAGIGIFLMMAGSTACTSRFWKRSFVSFGKKITLTRDCD